MAPPKKQPRKGATRKASLDEIHRVRLTGATIAVASGDGATDAVPIGPAGVVVGAGSECDVRLDDTLVSRRHLELRAEEHGVRAVDLGSTNGTRVGAVRVHEVVLTTDTMLTLGHSNLEVRFSTEPLDLRISPRTRFGAAVAHSAAMRHVFALLEQAARSSVTVLLEGDSGTGKDVLANALHEQSERASGPLVVVDCGAMVEGLVESELFGHEQGAFTGASQRRVGAFEQAHTGTLFLDEIGELPLEIQPKLLRALEGRSFRRVGGSQTISVDVRVVAATNKRLSQAVRDGAFREDLYYRLAVVHVRLPRLRDRPEDILPLAEIFLRGATGDVDAVVPPALAGLLSSYGWPGNARELRNVVERFATFDRADARLLFGEERAERSEGAGRFAWLERLPYHDAKKQLIDSFHRAVLPQAVERAGSVARAAEQLGLPRASLYRMLQQLRDEPGAGE